MKIFGRKEEKKSDVEVKKEAVLRNIGGLLDSRLQTMSDVYGKDVMIAWLDAIEDQYFRAGTDSELIDRAHTTARTCNIW